MSTDPSAAYADAITKVQAAAAVVQRMIDTIKDAARVLQKWQSVMVVKIPEGNALPASRMPASGTIDGLLWPSAADLGKALAAYHSCVKDAQGAWNGLPDPIKAQIPRP